LGKKVDPIRITLKSKKEGGARSTRYVPGAKSRTVAKKTLSPNGKKGLRLLPRSPGRHDWGHREPTRSKRAEASVELGGRKASVL